MSESPFEERKLEVLRASCVGQPREMVNLFCVPMKNMSTYRRIEKALDRLRQGIVSVRGMAFQESSHQNLNL